MGRTIQHARSATATTTQLTESDPPETDDRPRDEHQPDDEPMVIFEFAVPAETLVLEQALGEFPDVVVELEPLVPTNNSPLPYLWTNGGQRPAFRAAVADDPHVDRIRRVATFEEGVLYGIEWADDADGLFDWIENQHEETAVLRGQGHDDEWILQLRFPDREQLSEFRTFYQDREIDLRPIRLYDLKHHKFGQYEVTAKQREALLRALEMGHFAIPREATLEEVADSLDISARALSERLRRGQTALVRNTLSVGRPDGVGPGGA